MLFKPGSTRLVEQLSKLVRTADGVMTYRAMLERRHAEGVLTHKEIGDGFIRWNRRAFNRMDGAQQRAYEAKLKAEKHYYAADANGNGVEISKTIYDALDLPDRITRYHGHDHDLPPGSINTGAGPY